MMVREYRESDLAALKRIHAAQTFPYTFPDLQNPLFLTRIVLTESGGAEERIRGAAILRLTAEAYLLLDPAAGTPKERWQSLLVLHEAARRDAWQRGLEDVHAWLPPAIAQKFGRRIEKLGWTRDDDWTPYCKRLVPNDAKL
ncbi:MAG TPA: hypothetical protein VN025_04080 [Candidatus Dormibacteraeota bacterium]|jgi:hypothetical protein|nr:hypothetical protein [Candidatus Dormibacteraeota bacterium]